MHFFFPSVQLLIVAFLHRPQKTAFNVIFISYFAAMLLTWNLVLDEDITRLASTRKLEKELNIFFYPLLNTGANLQTMHWETNYITVVFPVPSLCLQVPENINVEGSPGKHCCDSPLVSPLSPVRHLWHCCVFGVAECSGVTVRVWSASSFGADGDKRVHCAAGQSPHYFTSVLNSVIKVCRWEH